MRTKTAASLGGRRRTEQNSIAPQTRIELQLPDHRSHRLEFPLLLLCFFLSGMAALLYQTAWMRQFAVVFGTSELAIATVLAAYMAGLAGGSWVAGRLVHRVRRLVLTYGVLEFTIAAGALLVPLGLAAARWMMVWWLGGQPAPPDAGGWRQPALYVAATFVILLIPTACMGATLPLLTRHAVQRSDQIGRRVGLLYAMNTLGAVAGTIVAGFLLLPFLGLFRTTLCGVAVNVAVFGFAVWLTRLGTQTRNREANADPRAATGGLDASPSPTWHSPVAWYRGGGVLMPMMLVSGFMSFTYEVLWARLLGHVIGGSTHAFATMLATFLTGITIGSTLAAPLARSRRSALIGFLSAQVGIALCSAWMFWFLEAGIGWLASENTVHLDPVWNALSCSLVLLPSTICIGMTFPFAVRAVTDEPTATGEITGRVYAWNTIGGVMGAIVAGFVLVPELAFTGTVQLAVAGNLLLAAAALLLLPIRRPLAWGAVAAALLLSGAYRPATPHELLRSSSMSGKFSDDMVYLGVGRSSTVRVGQMPLFYMLTNNGLPEALIAPRGAPTVGMELHQWLTALPLIARPDAQSICVIGFGSGGAVEIVPDSVKEIDIIELEPLVIDANRHCADLRRSDPLADKRINVILNDARGALSLTDKRYDIVVSQPSHPWTAGASHLYTKEFLEQVRDHLTEDGVLLQWMSATFVDEELFRTLGSTLLSVFPNVRLYQPKPNVMFFLASAGDLDLERRLLQTGQPLRSHPEAYALMGITGLSSLAAALRLDEEGIRRICEGAPPNTDDHNRLAFAATHNRASLHASHLEDVLNQHDALLNRDSSVYRRGDLPLNPSIIALRMNEGEFSERVFHYQQMHEATAMGDLLAGAILQYEGKREQAINAYWKAWKAEPTLLDAAWWLCELSVRQIASGTAPPEILEVAESLPDPEASVLEAAIALQLDDFAAIHQLEPRLAAVHPDKSCYSMALNCRCAWRAAATGAPNRRQLAEEAIDLADRCLAILPRTETFLMRFNCVVMLRDPHGIVETALRLAMNRYDSKNGVATFKSDQAGAVVLPQLERLRRNPEANQQRLEVVRRLYDKMHARTAGLFDRSANDALLY
jgi:spermidine synthase